MPAKRSAAWMRAAPAVVSGLLQELVQARDDSLVSPPGPAASARLTVRGDQRLRSVRRCRHEAPFAFAILTVTMGMVMAVILVPVASCDDGCGID